MSYDKYVKDANGLGTGMGFQMRTLVRVPTTRVPR